MKDDRGPWYLLTGVVIGVILGLVYAWRIDPVVYEKTAPSALRAEDKDRYRALIAAAYASNGNLPRAEARLEQLRDEDMARAVVSQAQRAQAENHPQAEVRALGLLAVALSQGSGSSAQAAQNPGGSSPAATRTATGSLPTSQATSTASPAPASSPSPLAPTAGPTSPGTPALSTLSPTITPLPTRTPTPTQGAPFVLKDMRLVCNASLVQPLIMIEALDASGNPVAGAEVVVQWDGNEDRFFTGLKPELGLGYADFEMTPGTTYSVHLAEGGEPVSNLKLNECESSSGDRYWGSWQLIFVQP